MLRLLAMRFVLFCLWIIAASPAVAMGPWQGKCGDVEDPCRIGDRSYHVKLPDDWNGSDPLPVLFHFHGWQRQGSLIIRHQRISGATRRRGVLLVAPNGERRTWDFWDKETEDVDFAFPPVCPQTSDQIKDHRLGDRGHVVLSAEVFRCENDSGSESLL